MFFKILLQHFSGYVTVRVEGYFIEKFINKCIAQNIVVWNIKREKSTIIYANIGIKNFKQIRKIAKDTKCKIKILDKKGIPFFLNKYRKRKIFGIILLLIIVSLITLSQFVWKVEISGLDKIDENEIRNILEDKNLKVGGIKSKIDTQVIINEIRLKRSDISWVGIEINGTKASIKIVEAEAKPEVINEEDYCNIVADKTAQIVKISAQSGVPKATEGSIVKEGDILIAGWMEGKYTGTRFVHAKGEVKAKVWYTEKVKVDFKQQMEKYTNNEEIKYKIKINNFQINLFKTLSKFEKYDTIETENQIRIFDNFYLPIKLIKITNKEKIDEEITYGSEEAKNKGVEIASEKIKQNLPEESQVLQKYIDYSEEQDSVTVEVTYEVLESIGTKEKIVF